jgi:hypothetical protein
MNLESIQKYSSDLNIDITKKLNDELAEPKYEIDPLFTTFLDYAIDELYLNEVQSVLFNKEGIVSKLKGDSINFFGALSELCIAGIFAPYIKKHSSPDLILSVNNKIITIEIRNRISSRGKINNTEWPKEHKSTLDKIEEKKKRNPDFIFMAVLRRAYEPEPKHIKTNVPKKWISQVILTPGREIKELLDSGLNGIFVYDSIPLYINSEESRITNTSLAHGFVDMFEKRLIEMFSQDQRKSTHYIQDALYVLNLLKEKAV